MSRSDTLVVTELATKKLLQRDLPDGRRHGFRAFAFRRREFQDHRFILGLVAGVTGLGEREFALKVLVSSRSVTRGEDRTVQHRRVDMHVACNRVGSTCSSHLLPSRVRSPITTFVLAFCSLFTLLRKSCLIGASTLNDSVQLICDTMTHSRCWKAIYSKD